MNSVATKLRTVDHLVEQMDGLRALLPLDAIKAELVRDEKVPLRVPLERLVHALVGQSGGEVDEHPRGGRVEDAAAKGTDAQTDRPHEVALAGLADENHVGTATDELCGGELLKRRAVDGPVERIHPAIPS